MRTQALQAALARLDEYQQQVANWRPADGNLKVVATAGCHEPTAHVLLATGQSICVSDVTEGNRLLGPDGTARTVLSIVRGRAPMWRVVPVKGEPFVVTGLHQLPLFQSKDTRLWGKRADPTVDEVRANFHKWSSAWKLMRSGAVEFPDSKPDLPIDPYFMGVLLGDGSNLGTETLCIHKPDLETRELAYSEANRWGLRVREVNPGTSRVGYALVGPGNKRHALQQCLFSMGFRSCCEKFIPPEYLTASIEERKAVLAGLLDTDGHMERGGYDFISKSQRLSDGVAFLARSLGLAAYVVPSEKGCQTGAVGTYWRVSISGDCSDLPLRIPRKIAPPRRQVKSVLRTGLRAIEPVGEGPYVGFQVSGDHLYLMADFTITHNSGKSSAAVALAARLVADGDVNPARLVMTTFSNKGGEVMRQRIQALGIRSISRIGTFHALGLRALRTDEGVRAGGPGAKSRWAMSHCLEADAKTRASTTPASWVLWKAIVKKGKVPGSGDKGMNLPVPFEGYAKAVSLFRARGLTPATAPVDEAMLLGCPNIRKAWTMYEEAKAALHVWDFDDVLGYYLKALREGAIWPDADVVMVDEAQDNSRQQLEIAKALAGIGVERVQTPGRIVLIGDPTQCVDAGAHVQVGGRTVRLGDVRVGDEVQTTEAGHVAVAPVEAVHSSCAPLLLEFHTESGHCIRVTPDHKMFTEVAAAPGVYHYLMYKSGYGFRTGVTGGKQHKRATHRAQEEQCDKMWIMGSYQTEWEARHAECRFAYTHGIPMDPFQVRPGSRFEHMSEEELKTYFQEFESNGLDALVAHGLEFDYAPHSAKCSAAGRIVINIALAASKGYSEVHVESRHIDPYLAAIYGFRGARRGCVRLRRWFRNYADAREFAEKLEDKLNEYEYPVSIVETLSTPGLPRLFVTPACGVHVGMSLPVMVKGQVRLSPIVSRQTIQGEFETVDLSLSSGNFVADGIVVHNCVHVWRGAYPALFRHAETELNAKTIVLPNNYRSLQPIVDLGNRSAAAHAGGMANAISTRGAGEGGVTLKGGFDSDLDEAMWVGEQIASLVKAGYNPDKFAILARTNAALVNFQAALTSLNVPLVIVGSDSLFGSREAQDIVSYVRLLIYDDVEAVERVVNRPVRFVTRSGIDTLKAEMRAGFSLDAAILRIRHVVSASDARGLDEFARAVATMRRMAWAEVPRRLLTLLGATEGAEASDNSEPDEDRPAVYRAMCNVASRFQDPSDFVRFADKCVDAGRTVSADEGHMAGKTLLSTIHRIKGGQAAVVFLSASEGQLPHWRSVPVGLLDEAAWDHPDMESELRLWYVGVTRAEDALVVTWSKEATKNRRGGPSRFIVRFMQEHLTADDVVDFQNGGTKKKAKRRKGGEDGPMGELDDLDELSEED